MHDLRRNVIVLAFVLVAPRALGQVFVDRSVEMGIAPAGEHAAWGDVNRDGYPDLWAGGVLWVNRAGKSFGKIDAPGQGVVVDLDNDGDGELVSYAPVAISELVWDQPSAAAEHGLPVQNRGLPVQIRATSMLPEIPPTVSRGVAAADYNRDGYVDLFFGGYEDWGTQTTFPSLLLLNEGGKSFRIAWSASDRRARGVTACDFDGDGDSDIYVSNYRLQPNTLLVNDGSARFSDDAAARNAAATSEGFAGGHSIGACFGDFDNDGNIDIFAGNFAHVDSRGDQPKSRFLRNRGANGAFTFDDLRECGVWYQESYASPACADFDNDGRLDLYLTTVYADASFGKKNFPVLYRSDSIGRETWAFKDVTEGSGLERLPPTYQAAWADVDRDGRVDLVTAGRLFMNNGPKDVHWLGVRLEGDGKTVNRDAIGAVVRVQAGDRVLTRQVEAGTGEGNSNALLLHLGLGASAEPVDVTVRWPDGTEQRLLRQQVDRVLDVVHAPTTSP
ncbi:MAG: hypothetical protein RL354_1113 [Planctomycetota bacterium]|jgi:hypothetical protein